MFLWPGAHARAERLTLRTDSGDLLRLRSGVHSAVSPDGEFHLVAWPRSECFGWLGPDAHALVRRLAASPCPRRELTGGPDAGPLLDRLTAGGWLEITVRHAGESLYTLQPLGPPTGSPNGVDHDVVLSRFAVLHRDGDEMVLTSPRAWCRLRVQDPRVLSLLGTLTPGRAQPAGGKQRADRLPRPVADRILRDLTCAGFAVSGQDAEDTELRLAQWSPAELWFHASSRPGRHAPGPVGATLWARDLFDPVPERRIPFSGSTVRLPRPDLAAVRSNDPPLTEILEDRRSVRDHDDGTPIGLGELGEFLYRCAGVRPRPGPDGTVTPARPYPAGGGLYELELYPVVRLVAGLEPGLYHYDAPDHRLVRVRGPDPAVRRLLTGASWSTATPTPPQVLIVISARFGRMMWKYQHMGYAVILKNVGVLFHVMYAVATAMRLAPCAVGSGDSDAFAEATGLDRFTESSVGEFMLGSRP